MRALILCAGEAKRWGNYLDSPKQLVTVEGEVLLHRTVRQCVANGVTDVVIVGSSNVYDHPAARLYIPDNITPTKTDADKFLSSRSEWNDQGRTAILYGDVWYSDRVIASIATHKQDGWGVWRRPHRSKLTGCTYGEVFGLGWRAQDNVMVDKVLGQAVQSYRTSNRKIRPAGWQLLGGFKLNPPGRAYLADDWTEDFDHPRDLDRWLTRRQEIPYR